MSFECGFFNSINGDRKYNAEDMTNPYKRIVSNGVFAKPDGSQSTDMQVVANGGLSVRVKAGEGMFNGKWAKLDADMVVDLSTPNPTNPRIDSVIVRIDSSAEIRAGSVIYREGVAAANPIPPVLENNEYVKEYRLANIRVEANATDLSQAKITDRRPSDECGFVSNLLANSDISATYAQWQKQFDEWFGDVKETLATSTLIRSYTSTYKTATQDERTIPINISQFNKNLDILQVFINGLRLVPDLEYLVVDNASILLTKGVDVNTPVSFVVYKSVDGSEAETVVEQVYELQMIQATANGGGVKKSCTAGADVLNDWVLLGAGLHTMYSPAGCINTPKSAAFRYLGHLTSETNGWLLAFQADGSVYSNYLVGGEWKGWRTIYEVAPAALWEGASFMNENQTVTPSKKLSECKNGWILVFSDYDDATSKKNNYNAVSFVVPKKNASGTNWNGSSFMCCLPREVKTDGTFVITAKQVYIYDDHITGFVANNAGAANRDVILSAIYEF